MSENDSVINAWLQKKTDRAWLQFVADLAPPLDVIEVIESTFKTAYLLGIEAGINLEKTNNTPELCRACGKAQHIGKFCEP